MVIKVKANPEKEKELERNRRKQEREIEIADEQARQQGQTYQIGGVQMPRSEYIEKSRALKEEHKIIAEGGIGPEEIAARKAEREKKTPQELISAAPEEYGLERPTLQEEEIKKEGIIKKGNTLSDAELELLPMEQRPKAIGFGGKEIMAPQLTTEESKIFSEHNIKATLTAFGAAIGVPALQNMLPSATGILKGWKIKTTGQTMVNPAKVVKTATAIKNTSKARKVIDFLQKNWVVVGLVGGSVWKGLDFFTRKVPEQQQALNTLGTITSTIVGDSTSGAGDWRAGLKELDYIEKSLLQMEQDIKSGTINEATLSYSGEDISISADIYDQLSTIAEGKRDITSFALEGSFPELTPFEIQEMLRELEEEGYIEGVDLTTARRETSE